MESVWALVFLFIVMDFSILAFWVLSISRHLLPLSTADKSPACCRCETCFLTIEDQWHYINWLRYLIGHGLLWFGTIWYKKLDHGEKCRLRTRQETKMSSSQELLEDSATEYLNRWSQSHNEQELICKWSNRASPVSPYNNSQIFLYYVIVVIDG